MTPEEQKAYDTQQYRKNPRYRLLPEDTSYYPIWQKLCSWVSADESICEIGCGSGQLANLLIKEKKNYQMGIDYIPEAIQIAKELNPGAKDKFINMDVTKTGSLTGYNTIIATEVLEHIDNDLEVVKGLPKNTRFIFSVPNFMTKGHKRCFTNMEAIKDRYGRYLTIQNYYIYIGKRTVFLIDSTRK